MAEIIKFRNELRVELHGYNVYLPDPNVESDESGVRLGHQEQSHITRGNIFSEQRDNKACDAEELGANDVEESLPRLVGVSVSAHSPSDKGPN